MPKLVGGVCFSASSTSPRQTIIGTTLQPNGVFPIDGILLVRFQRTKWALTQALPVLASPVSMSTVHDCTHGGVLIYRTGQSLY